VRRGAKNASHGRMAETTVPLTLTEVRDIVADVAKEQHSELDIVGATRSEGDSGYAEVIVSIRGCQIEPCRLVIGVNRNVTKMELRHTVSDRLRRHNEEHGRQS
jgi:hypothetical protein